MKNETAKPECLLEQERVEDVATEIQFITGEIHLLCEKGGDNLEAYRSLLLAGLEKVIRLTEKIGAEPWGEPCQS